jgi:hypothetical protein
MSAPSLFSENMAFKRSISHRRSGAIMLAAVLSLARCAGRL